MRLNISSSGSADSIAWWVVKGVLLLLVVWVVMPPTSQGVSGRSESGLKTVLPGRIRATQITPITLEASAHVVSVAVKAGDRVKAGQVLAVLESAEIEKKLERAHRRVQLAASRLEVKPNNSHLLWQEQQRSAEQRCEEAKVRLATFSIEPMELAYNRAEKEVASMTRMVQQRLATAQDLESARKGVEMASANLLNGRSTLTRLKQEAAAADSQLRMVMLQKDVTDPTDMTAATLELEDAKESLEGLEKQKRALRVVAPQDGTVLAVNVQPGTEAGGWAPLFQISDINTLQVEVPITARIAQMIHRDTPVKIVIPGDPPRELDGTVGELQLVPDQLQNSHVVRIPISNPGSKSILVGMECTVEFPHGGQV